MVKENRREKETQNFSLRSILENGNMAEVSSLSLMLNLKTDLIHPLCEIQLYESQVLIVSNCTRKIVSTYTDLFRCH